MRRKLKEIKVAVAGQPNSGKSTIFNLLTGGRQHVANYPGITVEKKTGTYRIQEHKVFLTDLPGTYSLTSYSLEERIARDFLLQEKPEVIVDIVDATNLERNLYLVFQLAEIGIPLVIDLNMADVAKSRGFQIDTEKLSQEIGAEIVPTVGNKGRGKRELRQTIHKAYESKKSPRRLDYGKELESILKPLGQFLSKDANFSKRYPIRWLAVKLLENDSEAQRAVKKYSTNGEEILSYVEEERKKFISQYEEAPEKSIAHQRYREAEKIVGHCVKQIRTEPKTLTDRIDMVVCNRFSGLIVLLGTIYAMYNLSIVQGYKITNYTWPLLAGLQKFLVLSLPPEGFVFDPLLRAMPLGVIGGVIAVLNYVPIFIILFALIAIMEDTGYLARMSFILDRVFRYFGLHGQSVLPLVLGGVYVGGCAIPGVMACRGIKDEKARLATMLVVPLMNCLAKIPLYVLLLGLFFAATKGIMMFFIGTITIIIALGVAKILSLTILKRKESAPFILEMPPYHLPTIGGVLRRCLERLGIFIKKIITVVMVVMCLVYLLINFPGLSKERKAHYNSQANRIKKSFMKKIGEDNPYTKLLAGDGLINFTKYRNDYRAATRGVEEEKTKKVIEQKFRQRNFEFFKIVKKGKYELEGKKIKDKDAKKVHKTYKKVFNQRRELRAEKKKETIKGSFLGRVGIALEPITKKLGFNWQVNIALISAFAAKENAVGTIGVLYESPPTEREDRLEKRLGEKEGGWTPLHALAIILFMAMYPPCIPTLLMIRVESGSTMWMLFATFYPIILGIIFAFLAFTAGNLLGFSGLKMMITIYTLAIVFMVGVGFIKRKEKTVQQKTAQDEIHR
ncbi:MAG: ferrous iron transport protein B [Candidatus Omnitrophica bacterium]|nr:ferrous iron transport protein B [Candidatus Omnitrophota bacterium]